MTSANGCQQSTCATCSWSLKKCRTRPPLLAWAKHQHRLPLVACVVGTHGSSHILEPNNGTPWPTVFALFRQILSLKWRHAVAFPIVGVKIPLLLACMVHVCMFLCASCQKLKTRCATWQNKQSLYQTVNHRYIRLKIGGNDWQQSWSDEFVWK